MNIYEFNSALLGWFDLHQRSLPWRNGYEPYYVWVSEIMAQQTQMERVVPYFERWIEAFPNIEALAEANEEHALKLWEGLGYYNRCRNMLKAARVVADEHGGIFPSEFADVLALPGVGKYTAGAICGIAFNQPVPCVDANAKRVFARILDIDQPLNSPVVEREVENVLCRLMPESGGRQFNQAVMELGAMLCGKYPSCDMCPVQHFCLSLEREVVQERPVLPPPKEVVKVNVATGILPSLGRVLIQKRRPDDVWPGLWEFPGGCIEEGESPEEAVVREYMEEVELAVSVAEKIGVVKYSYTKFRVTLHCYLLEYAGEGSAVPVFHEAVEGRFVLPSELDRFAFPSGHNKLMALMRQDVRFSSFFDS